MRLLITGITGFAGSYFAELALRQGAEVYGCHRRTSRRDNIDGIADRVHLLECDLRDAGAARHLIDTARPDLITHLAAVSSVAASWKSPGDTMLANVGMQVHLLEAIRAAGVKPRILVAGSAEEYGWVEPHELPVAETAPLRPLSPYAVSKVAQDLMGYQYFKSIGLPIVRSRAFNHAGPRHADSFAASSFARQIAEIELGRRPPELEVGNLDAERDFTDVRDVVRAYWLLLERGEPGDVYNICSGRTWRLADVVDILLASAHRAPIAVRRDAARLRPAEAPLLRGDAGKIRRAVGWQPEIPFEETVRSMLAYWRERSIAVGEENVV